MIKSVSKLIFRFISKHLDVCIFTLDYKMNTIFFWSILLRISYSKYVAVSKAAAIHIINVII